MKAISKLVVGTCLMTACAASTNPSTGIAIEVRRGPITPVEHEGVDNTAPVAGASVAVRTLSGLEVERVTTDSAGTATASVPPGDYQVGVLTCPGALALPGPLTVSVKAGEMTAARLECDTGIR